MKPIYAILILIAVCFLAYGNSLFNDFTYDDKGMMDEELFSNVNDLKSLLTLDYYRFSGEMTFRPLVTLTYFLDFTFWRFDPFGYHLTNLLWHAGAVVAAFLLFFRLFGSFRAAFLGGLIFAVHPVQTEAVNAVGFREDPICALFFLLSLLAYLEFRAGIKKKTYYSLSLLFFFLALLSKEMAATLPLLVVLYDFLFPRATRKRRPSAMVRPYLGYAGAGLFYLVLRYLVFFNPSEKAVGLAGGPLLTRLALIPQVCLTYFKLFLFPFNPSVEYSKDAFHPLAGPVSLTAFALLGGLLVIVGRHLGRRRTVAGFLASFVLLSLLPVLNVVPISNLMAERYLYLPFFGFAGLTALLLTRLSESARGKRTAAAAAILVLVCCLSLTIKRNTVWKNSLSLWKDGARKAPGSARARLNLGVAYGEKGMVEEAAAEYERSIELRPTAPDAYNNLGLIRVAQNRLDEGIAYYRQSIEADPGQVRAYMNLALAYIQKGEEERGVEIIEKLVELKPLNAKLRSNLAGAYLQVRRPEKAAEEYRKALRIKPYLFDALLGLGKLHFQRGRWEEAAAMFEKACRARGASYTRSISMGNVLFARGFPDRAAAEFRNAVKLRPRSAEGHNNLGIVLLEKKEYRAALDRFTEARKFEPENPRILLNAAKAAYLDGRRDEAEGFVLEIFEAERIPEEIARALDRFYLKNRLLPEAVNAYETILERRPRYGRGYLRIARAYLLLGRPEDAAARLNQGSDYLTEEDLETIRRDPVFRPILSL